MSQDDTSALPTSTPYRFLGDQPHTQPDDPLGYDALADRLASVITESRSSTPFVIGIEGPWGIGKSSVMLKLQRSLVDTGLKTVYYNAWNHEGRRDATEALLKTVLSALDEDILQRWMRFDRNQKLKRWSVWLLRLPVLALAARIGLGNAVDKIWDRLEKSVDVANQFNERFSEAMREWSKRKATDGEPRLLAVFIDDLDRCSEKSVAEILTVVKLYLTVPKCVFIMGYDRMALDEMVHHRIGVSTVVKGSMYLEKMIQVPFSIPQPNTKAARACLDQSLEEAGVAPLFAGSEDIIIDSTDGNPRRMKRFINVFVLRWLEVEAAGAEPPPDLLALLLLVNLHDRAFSFLIERDLRVLHRFGDYVRISEAVDRAPIAGDLDAEVRSLIQEKSYFLLAADDTPREDVRESLRTAFPASFQGYRQDKRLCDLVLAIQKAASGVSAETLERVVKASWEARPEPMPEEEPAAAEVEPEDTPLWSKPSSLEQYFSELPERFQPKRAENIVAVMQYDISGEGGGQWTVRIADGKCTVQRGLVGSRWDFIVSSPSDVWLGIVRGEIDQTTAYMSGQFKFFGKDWLLMRRPSIFGEGEPLWPKPSSLEQYFSELPERFRPDRARNIQARMNFNISGAGGGQWAVRIAGGKCTVKTGLYRNYDLTIASRSDVWLGIVRGEIDEATAFMAGQFTFTGVARWLLMQRASIFGEGEPVPAPPLVEAASDLPKAPK